MSTSNSTITMYNLSGATLSVENSVTPSLDPSYWGPSAASSKSSQYLQPTQVLQFNRDTGITRGDTWTFTVAFSVDGMPVSLQVTLLGTWTSPGSDMSYALFVDGQQTGFWSDNTSKTLQFIGQSGVAYSVCASFIARFSDAYDIILTIAQNMMLGSPMVGPIQQLLVGQSLNSDNGLVSLVLQPDGLHVVRTVFNTTLWQSPLPSGTVANTAVMQYGADLDVQDVNGVKLWGTDTNNEGTGVVIVLGSDSNLQILDIMGNSLYSTKLTSPDWGAYTYQYTDGRGYSYDETSEYWKQLCQILPCSLALAWPGYETFAQKVIIQGQPAVIQLWRGHCERFFGDSNFPGGYGAEVGVYRVIDGKDMPKLDGGPAFIADLLELATSLSGGEIWWPAPDLVETIQFTLYNDADGGSVFFDTAAQSTYWNCKWMTPDSYAQYKASVATPSDTGYRMEYTVNGVAYSWPASS
jgi:hypothetical protein